MGSKIYLQYMSILKLEEQKSRMIWKYFFFAGFRKPINNERTIIKAMSNEIENRNKNLEVVVK